MAKTIRIYGLNPETQRVLIDRAERAGISLTDLIRRHLEESAGHPTLEEVQHQQSPSDR